jgi:hypothetical protein
VVVAAGAATAVRRSAASAMAARASFISVGRSIRDASFG